ncbi:MAG: ankyrin repeat domain-containing protein [Rickettsiales bacterium]|nr:ankyrin repeat domain-containing protein [Rickettsiales bacterium]
MSVGAAGLVLWASIKYGVGAEDKSKEIVDDNSATVSSQLEPQEPNNEFSALQIPDVPEVVDPPASDNQVLIPPAPPSVQQDDDVDPFAPQIVLPDLPTPPVEPNDTQDAAPLIGLPDVTVPSVSPTDPVIPSLALPGDGSEQQQPTRSPLENTEFGSGNQPRPVAPPAPAPTGGNFANDLIDDGRSIDIGGAERFTWEGIIDGTVEGLGPPVIPTSPTEGLIIESANRQRIKEMVDEIDGPPIGQALAQEDDAGRIIERRPGKLEFFRLPYDIQQERPTFDYKTDQRPEIFTPDRFGNNSHLSELTLKKDLHNEFFFAAHEGNLLGLKGLHQSNHVEDVNIADEDGNTALIYATKQSRVTAIRYLLVNGADPNKPNAMGVTPLHVAASIGQADVIDALLTRGADISIQDIYGNTPFDYAFENGNYIILSMLTGEGVDLNRHLMNGSTLLISAIKTNDFQKLQYLIHAGADIDQMDANGYSPLMLAGYNGRERMVDILLALGADVNARDQYNRTAAELADIANYRDEFNAIQSEYMRQQLAMHQESEASSISGIVSDDSKKFFYDVGSESTLADTDMENQVEMVDPNRNSLPIMPMPDDEDEIDYIK